MVAVVGPLHLHDPVPAGGGPGDPDRVHRRLGPGVHEPHLLPPETPVDLLGQGHGGRGGHGEVRAGRDGLLDRLDDPRMGMADHVHAEAAVEIEVIQSIDVPHVRALGVGEVDRVRVAGLEVRGDAVRERPHGPGVKLRRPG